MKNAYRIGHVAAVFALFLALCAGAALAGETVTAEKASEIALAQTGGGRVMELDRDYRGDGRYVFRLEILADNGAFHVEVDAETGKLVQFVKKHGSKWSRRANAFASGSVIPYEEALAIAFKHTNGGTVVESDVDVKRSGRVVYEFEIVARDGKYEIEIDGATGDVLELEKNGRHIYVPRASAPAAPVVTPQAPVAAPPAAAVQTPVRPAGRPMLPADAAQSIAIGNVGGGYVAEYRILPRAGKLAHEVVVVNDSRRHTMQVDDATGRTTEVSVEDAN